MKKFVKASLVAGMLAAPIMADEQFGGIGVTIYQVPAGVYVAEVIPGGPAADTKIKKGDVIVAVDGVSLKGQNIEFSKDQIRGQVDKPVELTYVSDGDTLSAVVRRTSMLVKDFNADDVTAWYGDKDEFNAQELETFASGSETDKQLLAVLSRGTIVAGDAEKVSARNLNGVFVKKAEKVEPKTNPNKGVKSNGAVLKSFSRNAISFTLKTAGTAVVKVSGPNGEEVASVRVDNAPAGFNSVAWNSENVPSGRYMVSIEQSFGVAGKFAVLK
ncbi:MULTISPECIES: S41 family peptidase [unclassified Fibrobacter]|uniref:S41 family peptidase n=1 Tax=unclassified Fibrobacter TaxID=2634177 RepID=UPI0025C723CD|nr:MULTISPECIES: PDZ domain-containing protein [unclassified Fibrobacter]